MTRLPDGAIDLACRIGKGWTVRRPGTRIRPEHPGTAVRWDGSLLEVVAETPDASGGVVYRLAPWPDRHAIRVIEHYDEASEAVRTAEQARRAAAIQKRRLSLLLAPILGHLPAAIQLRMESEFGAPARGMTIASALPLLVLGLVGVLAALIASFGGGAAFAGWPILPLPLAALLFGESLGRLGYAFVTGEPIGSLAGTIFATVFASVVRGRLADLGSPARRYSSTPRSDGSEQEES
jgi:hypothetical protein